MSASQVASSPTTHVEGNETTSPSRQESYSAGDEDEEDGTVYFVLEEGSGYMESSLHFLAVVHTIISFFCIIGYYCLKVPRAQATTPEGLNGADRMTNVEEQKIQ